MPRPPIDTAVKSDASQAPARWKIVAGARRHFLAEGFRNVTMDDLAEELGMSKKTLYAHFASKTDLVKAVMLQKLGQAEADLEAITSRRDMAFADSLHDMLACLQRHGDEIRPPFIRDVRRDAPELFSIVEQSRTAMIHKHFDRMLKAGRKAGMIRKDVPVRLIVEILVGATQAMVNPQKITELGLTPKEAYGIIIQVVLHGVLTDNGRSNL
ncbi:MAG: transcriptional regulator [Verrucomicrobiaceae bacterium]|nr:transcriptional regulator [Verrucomicrobiaceae bacterium]